MLQQMAVRHISIFFRCIVIKLHQHFSGTLPSTYQRYLPSPRDAPLAVCHFLTRYGTACRVDMERMQHHVAHARDNPTFVLPFRRRKHRLDHIKRLTVDFVGMVEIELPAVVHMIHIAVPHRPSYSGCDPSRPSPDRHISPLASASPSYRASGP